MIFIILLGYFLYGMFHHLTLIACSTNTHIHRQSEARHQGLCTLYITHVEAQSSHKEHVYSHMLLLLLLFIFMEEDIGECR